MCSITINVKLINNNYINNNKVPYKDLYLHDQL